MTGNYFLLLIFFVSISAALSQTNSRIQDIRLVRTPSVGYAGRVEIRYNGTWGTICDGFWSLNDATVACRMLDFDGAECARPNAYFGRASTLVPIWMDGLFCSGRETYLDSCPFRGWGPRYHFCSSHRDDSSAVCRNSSFYGPATLTVVKTTTRSITLSFPQISTSITSTYRKRYRIQYNSTISPFPRYSYYTPSRFSRGPYTVTISNLNRDTEYFFSVRLELTSSYCRFSTSYNSFSQYSTPIRVKTNITARPSNFQIRLVSPIRGLDFLGRVEVNYNNNGWGTVCDYRFDTSDANVICQQLNYTRAACVLYNARAGRGRVPIFMTSLQCSGAEILDDCTYTRYRNTFSITRNCRTSHADDVGVICYPGDDQFLPAPQNLTVSASGTSLFFRWKRYVFPSYLRSYQLLIRYTRSDNRRSYSYSVSSRSTSYRIYRIPLGVTINATITARGRFTQYSCYTYLNGDASETVSITTQEQPPSTAPRNFHVTVINCSAITAEWDSPLYNDLNGILRGYKLMYKTENGNEMTVDLNSTIDEYLIKGLEPSSRYTVSVLAYTVADGPRSIHLKVTTNSREICQTDVIDFFGLNGNDLDRGTFFSYNRAINIYCGSSQPNAEIHWFHMNGSRVGSDNRHLREGHFSNGTTVLQIGNERRVTLCDSGIYTCKANVTGSNGTARVQQRTYRVIFNRSPPTPQRPVVLNRTHDSATVSWLKSDCDGGHDIQYYNLKITNYRSFFFFRPTNRYIYNLDSSMTNYTLQNLEPRTTYYLSVQALGRDTTSSGYSSQVSFVTLSAPPTPPRYVIVKLVAPDTIMVSWTRPSVTNGVISYYTVYGTPFITQTTSASRRKRDADSSLQSVARNFSAATTSGNLTLPQVGVMYQVRVSATVLDTSTRINRESLFSSVTTNSTIFVPIQGLPVPANVRVSATTNNSITVSWNTPDANGDTITGYLIEYSAMIEGKSPEDNLVMYTHEGNITAGASNTSLVMQPLVPGSTYQVKVAVLTNRGEGKEVVISGRTQTAKSDFERYAYFHVRFGPVFSCASFRRDIGGQENEINRQIFDYLRGACNCGFTDANINTGFFSCGQQDHQIIYRAHILGTANYSAIDLVNLLQNWILTNRAYVTLNNFRMQLDSTCPTRLDTLDDPECPVVTQPPPTTPPPITTQTIFTNKPTTSKEKPDVTQKKDEQTPKETEKPDDGKGNPQGQSGNTQPPVHGALTGESLVILFVGLLVAFLFLILIVLLIVGMFWKFSRQSNKSSDNVRTGFTNDSSMRFSDLKKSGTNVDQSTDDKVLYNDTEKFEDDFNY